MKYEVLETCHAGGRYCTKGEIVEFKEEVTNKYLKPVGKAAPVKEKKSGQALKDLQNKPEIKTGMAAKKKVAKKKDK